MNTLKFAEEIEEMRARMIRQEITGNEICVHIARATGPIAVMGVLLDQFQAECDHLSKRLNEFKSSTAPQRPQAQQIHTQAPPQQNGYQIGAEDEDLYADHHTNYPQFLRNQSYQQR